MIVRRLLAIAFVVLGLGLWLIPSDVPALVARQRDVLLGRYSVDWCTTLIVMTLICFSVAWGIAFPSKLRLKLRCFRFIAVSMSLLISLVVVDVAWRMVRRPRYEEDSVRQQQNWPSERVHDAVRRRPPNFHYQVTYTDQPQVVRSWPTRAPGFPTITVELTTDERGYRNPRKLDQADIVVLGDSFAEGSRVDDRESWPSILRQHSGRSLYNLGISGSSPTYFLNAFEAIGLDLSPQMVLCMVYEGNDFRGESSRTATVRGRIDRAISRSPIRLGFKRAMIRTLAPINADAPLDDGGALSWLPVGIPAPPSPETKYYAFDVEDMLELYRTPQQFTNSRGWRDTTGALGEIIRLCRDRDIRLVFIYAPSAPHIVLPLVADHTDAATIHGLASFRRRDLPPPAQFKDELIERLDVMEQCFADYCRENEVEFISPTNALREKMRQGVQVYYTYDQHWTRYGQATVAEVVTAYLAEHPLEP